MAERSNSPVDSSGIIWLDQKPILRIVCAVVRTSRWHQLGIQLELDTAKLEDIKKEATGTQEKREQMFQLWLDTQPSASNRQLLNALKLKVMGEDVLAEQYEREAMSIQKSMTEQSKTCHVENTTIAEDTPTKRVVTTMAQEASHVLCIQALKLQVRYHKLLEIVQENAQGANVEVMKNKIRTILQEKSLYQSQAISAYCQAIDRVTTVDDVFRFLVKHHFVGYLNYNILKELSSKGICGAGRHKAKEKVIKYEKHFRKFIEEPAFCQLIKVFDDNPHLNPSTVVGLPIIVISLAERWVHRTQKDLQDWIPFLKENKGLLQSMGYKCILITYAIFPVDLLNVLDFLNNPDQIKLLRNNGITIEVPSDTLSMAAELRKFETQPHKDDLEIENKADFEIKIETLHQELAKIYSVLSQILQEMKDVRVQQLADQSHQMVEIASLKAKHQIEMEHLRRHQKKLDDQVLEIQHSQLEQNRKYNNEIASEKNKMDKIADEMDRLKSDLQKNQQRKMRVQATKKESFHLSIPKQRKSDSADSDRSADSEKSVDSDRSPDSDSSGFGSTRSSVSITPDLNIPRIDITFDA